MLERTQKRVGHGREIYVGDAWEKGNKKRRNWDGSFLH